MIQASRYSFLHALRPFSFPVAVTTCLIGLTTAWQAGELIPLNAVLVLIGGLLLQAGVNLINDYSDLALLRREPEASRLALQVQRNFAFGLGCFLAAVPIGLYLVLDRSFELLWLFLIGLLGALGYTLKPLNYKARGLAVALVFWLMGVLMVSGSHVAAGGELNGDILLLSVPISLLVSLLLLSNELRDYESDRRDGLKTLTVRIGYPAARRLFYLLLLVTLLWSLGLAGRGLLQQPWWLLAALPFAVRLQRYLALPEGQRRGLTPATGQLVMVFGLLFCLAL